MKTRKNYLTFFLFLTALLVLNSCTSIYTGNIAGNTVVNNVPYRHIGTVSVSNRCVYVFHIGGSGKKSQIIKLKEDLQKRYPLRNGLAWTNVAVEMKTGFFVLWDVRKATLSVDLVDFWPDTNTRYANYCGYYFNDSIYIPIPQRVARINTNKTDSITSRLTFLNADKKNVFLNKFIKVNPVEDILGKEIFVYYKGQLTYGIVEWYQDDYARVSILNARGQLKKILRHVDKLYKPALN